MSSKKCNAMGLLVHFFCFQLGTMFSSLLLPAGRSSCWSSRRTRTGGTTSTARPGHKPVFGAFAGFKSDSRGSGMNRHTTPPKTCRTLLLVLYVGNSDLSWTSKASVLGGKIIRRRLSYCAFHRPSKFVKGIALVCRFKRHANIISLGKDSKVCVLNLTMLQITY